MNCLQFWRHSLIFFISLLHHIILITHKTILNARKTKDAMKKKYEMKKKCTMNCEKWWIREWSLWTILSLIHRQYAMQMQAYTFFLKKNNLNCIIQCIIIIIIYFSKCLYGLCIKIYSIRNRHRHMQASARMHVRAARTKSNASINQQTYFVKPHEFVSVTTNWIYNITIVYTDRKKWMFRKKHWHIDRYSTVI